jgi:hypothetical protein
VLPEGVMGRVDDMQKVKWVKIYPSEIRLYLAVIKGVDASNVQFQVTRAGGRTDRFTVDEDAIADAVRSVTNIGVDVVNIDESFVVAPDEDSIVVENERV